jgi:polar amino acid transport system substrate-binding protein
MQNSNWLKVVGLVILIIIINLITNGFFGSSSNSNQNTVANKVINSGEIRIGYIIYNPYLYKDETTGKLTGISYDIVEATAKKLSLKTNWVEEVGWGSAIEGLKTGRYDVIGTQMWPNSSRAREAIFSISPMDNLIYPYVRFGDNRFSDLSKLNSDQITVVTTDGDAAVGIAKEDYPMAKVSIIPQMSSTAETLLNIVGRKADVAFLDPSAADAFIKANPNQIQRLGSTPVRVFKNDFVFARGEESMVSMWNTAIGELISEGFVLKTLKKYNVADYFSINK